MSWIVRALRSSIGSKTIMAVTGLMLFGFVIGHLVGNLLVFAGPEALNTYAQGLQDLGPGLWVVRLGLLTIVIVHLAVAARLVASNRSARPTPYSYQATVQASFASRSMILTGITIAAFVVFHLAHFTWHTFQKDSDQYVGQFTLDDGREVNDVYAMVIDGLQNPALCALYLVALVTLFVHLRHGLSSFFQTLGLHHPRYVKFTKMCGPLVATLILIGYLAIPLSILFHIVGHEA